jgi:uncharacterized damage-inducible protein DinB
MKQYLVDTFIFNDRANRRLLEKIKQLPQPGEGVRFFSHLINSQNKWLARISVYPKDPGLDWWEPVHEMENLEREWEKSISAWLALLNDRSEDALFEDVKWIGYDGGHWTVALKDIALQLNYHSIHHRAQIQTMIRAQGLEPDFVDYIGTVYRKIS